MNYELTIRCHVCGIVKSQGGFNGPVELSDETILLNAVHSPACLVVQSGQAKITRSQETEGSTQITVYTLEALDE